MAEDKILFQSHLNKARQDKFSLVLTIPNILKSIDNKFTRSNEYFDFETLQFSVWNVDIPSIAVPEQSMSMLGQPYYFSGLTRPTYQPVNVNFAIDNEFKNYWVLWKWLDLYNQRLEGFYANNPNLKIPNTSSDKEKNVMMDYRTDIFVYGKDEYENNKIKFTFKHSFISELGNISYNYRNKEEISCYFKFVFNQMEIQLLDVKS